MKRVLYVSSGQFGYVVGAQYYAKYLYKLGYNVAFICGDLGLPKIPSPKDVEVYYVPLNDCKSRIEKRKRLLDEVKLRRDNFDIFVVRYFLMCSILVNELKDKYCYIDYRTGRLDSVKYRRFLYNFISRIEMSFAYKVFILSEDLAKLIRLPKSRYILLPLGADDLSSGEPKEYIENLNLLYIGTLNLRNIEESVIGFARFYNEYKHRYKSLSYNIVGRGSDSEIKRLKDTISKYKMDGLVIFHGSKTHEESKELFDFCNCGVSYVPETTYFDCQPSTKIFEYTLSGLICVATSTSENVKVISSENGILCHSTPDSFFQALTLLYENRLKYDWMKVKQSLSNHSWESIVLRVFDKEFKALK